MILRIAAALAVVLGILGLLAILALLGSGPFAGEAARHMRALKDRSDPPPVALPVSLASFDSLPYRRPLAEYAPVEQRGVVVEGYIKHMLRAPDGDTHLEVTSAPQPPGSGSTYVTMEITPQFYLGAPAWGFERLRQTFRPSSGGGVTPWGVPPPRVRLTGWLLYDYAFETRLPGGGTIPFARRVSGWEVHPVTRIEVWDEARSAFVEVPR